MSFQHIKKCAKATVKGSLADAKYYFSPVAILLLPCLIMIAFPLNLLSAVEGSLQLPTIRTSSDDIKIKIVSAQHIRGTAGQIIKIQGNILKIQDAAVNSSGNSNGSGIAYISIVDHKDRVPVDLEDWSAEKALYIPSILPGQSLPLEWDVRLVKAGNYSVSILFNKNDDPHSNPVTSSRMTLDVAPKHNLNPNNVLPIAFGVPVGLMIAFGAMTFLRGRKTRIYG